MERNVTGEEKRTLLIVCKVLKHETFREQLYIFLKERYLGQGALYCTTNKQNDGHNAHGFLKVLHNGLLLK